MLCLKAVALLCVVADEEENAGEESDLLVAAALSKIDAGVALLECGRLTWLLSVFTREDGICVSAVFASRVLSRFSKSDASPQEVNAACVFLNRTRPLRK